nr:MAG TPA: hypothetical protein [Caudoviricetes sp.]
MITEIVSLYAVCEEITEISCDRARSHLTSS